MIEITQEIVKQLFPKRKENSNKGDFGKILNIVSSELYYGAGMLAALAALKIGAGISIFCSEDIVLNKLAISNFDLIYKSHGKFDFQTVKNIIETENISSIVFGCGISVKEEALIFTKNLIEYLKNSNINTVIDADGLNCIAKLNIDNLGENFILTPHPKELSGLLHCETSDIQKNREKAILSAQEKYNCTVILKGKDTLICNSKENIYKNTTGCSALAKAGTGDILAGIIGGLLAQNISPINAAICATYIHGSIGDYYKQNFTEYSMLASDMLNILPIVLKNIIEK